MNIAVRLEHAGMRFTSIFPDLNLLTYIREIHRLFSLLVLAFSVVVLLVLCCCVDGLYFPSLQHTS